MTTHPPQPLLSTSDEGDHHPHWDTERRELSFNGQLVKAYRLQATSQQAVIEAFAEQQWPRQIANPLPAARRGAPPGLRRRRLNDCLRNLNRAQKGAVRIRFKGNGTGAEIIWEVERVVD